MRKWSLPLSAQARHSAPTSWADSQQQITTCYRGGRGQPGSFAQADLQSKWTLVPWGVVCVSASGLSALAGILLTGGGCASFQGPQADCVGGYKHVMVVDLNASMLWLLFIYVFGVCHVLRKF